MNRMRYIVAEYAQEQENDHRQQPFDQAGNFRSMLPVHALLFNYHWSRLDDKHIIVIANFPAPYHKRIDAHDMLTILPSLASGKKLKHVMRKDAHWHALKTNLGADETWTMVDAVELLEQRHGILFGAL